LRFPNPECSACQLYNCTAVIQKSMPTSIMLLKKTNQWLRKFIAGSLALTSIVQLAIPVTGFADEDILAQVTYQGAYPVEDQEEEISARADFPGGDLFDVNAVVVTGDRDAVLELPNWGDYENDAIYAPMSKVDIEAFRLRILKDLQNNGYVFATVSVYLPSLQLGFLKLRVHVGEKGNVTVSGNRWHDAEKVLKAVGWDTGKDFNYNDFYKELYGVNTRKDLQVETQLKPRVDDEGRRVVDANFVVTDRYPISAAWNFSNTGTRESGEWRSRLTVQANDLAHFDELISLQWQTDPSNVDDINSVTSSINMPLGDEWSVTVFTGFSESDLDNVLPQYDILGGGYVGGFNFKNVLTDNDDYVLDASFGWIFQSVESDARFGGTTVADAERRLKVSMPRISLSRADKKFDRFGGRNFYTNTFSVNFSGQFGTSSGSEFGKQTNRPTSGDFFINNFQFARFQKLWGDPAEAGSWSLFTRVRTQLTNDSLPSFLKMGLGGADSVRGYTEREVTGDYGINYSFELRSPLITNFIPGMVKDEEYLKTHPEDWMMHRLQFVAFYDGGFVFQDDALNQLDDTIDLHGIGFGFRMGFTRYSQLKFDYGIPLQSSPDSSSLGEIHFSLQLQY